jgi:hypothetical protein
MMAEEFVDGPNCLHTLADNVLKELLWLSFIPVEWQQQTA